VGQAVKDAWAELQTTGSTEGVTKTAVLKLGEFQEIRHEMLNDVFSIFLPKPKSGNLFAGAEHSKCPIKACNKAKEVSSRRES